ncbi:hypothetical protein JTE90_007959 [Oedothorax gibbosus]|uniref:Uncharacterized protein n=1 Tax=Oedothorax gibbosus TaxID=931172 RepID=A0AAV6U7R4_9ARAC|nr:hypothetical protein JTE90_007959 [Oedothorax gibbosus]
MIESSFMCPSAWDPDVFQEFNGCIPDIQSLFDFNEFTDSGSGDVSPYSNELSSSSDDLILSELNLDVTEEFVTEILQESCAGFSDLDWLSFRDSPKKTSKSKNSSSPVSRKSKHKEPTEHLDCSKLWSNMCETEQLETLHALSEIVTFHMGIREQMEIIQIIDPTAIISPDDKEFVLDSEVAKNFSCGENKVAYLSVFGIAPHFSSLLKSRIKNEPDYVLLFDESMNEVNQSKQLDCHVRIWDVNKVTTRYFSSDFLGHATADLLFSKIKEKCLTLGAGNLLQLSMDGPNVNLKVHEMMMKEMKDEFNTTLLNVGTCGLHIMHNAFRDGCSAFPEVENAASAAYWHFKDSPARREDYASLNLDAKFPLKFCKHRWVENEIVLVRLLEILPDVKSYIKEIERKKLPRPNNKSFVVLQDMIKDELFPAKCNFILSVVKDIQPFLKLYQTDRPMLPFLNGDLNNLLKDLLNRFLKDGSLPTSSLKLLDVNIEDNQLQKEVTKINVGFVAKKMLKELNKKDFCNEKKVMEFYLSCRQLLLKLTKKLFQKCPLNFSLVRNMSFLDPRTLLTNKEANLKKLQNILQYLSSAGRVKEEACDAVIKEFCNFIADLTCMDTTKRYEHCSGDTFDPLLDRVDVFYYEFLSNPKYPNLWQVVKSLLLLSHGQASVERGFSINKNLLIENLKNETVVAKRVIDDHLKFIGGLKEVVITNELVISAAGARQKYMAYLDHQKTQMKVKVCGEKRKLMAETVDELKKKKIRLEKDIKELTKTSEEFSEKAEETSDIGLIAKANALRRHAREKLCELTKYSAYLDDFKLQRIKDYLRKQFESKNVPKSTHTYSSIKSSKRINSSSKLLSRKSSSKKQKKEDSSVPAPVSEDQQLKLKRKKQSRKEQKSGFFVYEKKMKLENPQEDDEDDINILE